MNACNCSTDCPCISLNISLTIVFDNLASGSLRVSIGIAESFRVVVVKEEERLTFKEKYIVFIFWRDILVSEKWRMEHDWKLPSPHCLVLGVQEKWDTKSLTSWEFHPKYQDIRDICNILIIYNIQYGLLRKHFIQCIRTSDIYNILLIKRRQLISSETKSMTFLFMYEGMWPM